MKEHDMDKKAIEPWITERLHEWSTIFDTCATCPAVNSARGYRLLRQPGKISPTMPLSTSMIIDCPGRR